MKTFFRTAAVVLCLASTSIVPSYAADNENACGAVLCLAGEMTGHSGGSACDSYITKYFSIIDYHNGHIDLTATPRDRLNFLNQCDTQGDNTKQSVNNKYGGASGL